MLNIDNELLDDLNTDNLLPIDNEIFELSLLIKENNLEIDESLVNTLDNQYLAITNFIVNQYLNKEKLPDKIKKLVQNSYNYKIYLLKNIQNRMKNIIDENSIYIFKEVYITLNLLSNGNKYNLLSNDNMFSINELSLLLNDYESRVQGHFISNDNKNFDLLFKYYLTTLEVLNEICVINSLDIQRKKNINEVLELITNSISNIKSKIRFKEDKIELLNSILGKLLLYFTNMPYIQVDTKEILIKKYMLMLQKIFDGYELLNQKDKYYLSFLDKSTSLILTLIYKLKIKLNIENINFSESSDLNNIYMMYDKNVNTAQKIECNNLNDFRDKLIGNYKYLYGDAKEINYSSYTHPLDLFISKNTITNIDMIVVYDTILYSENIKKERLDSILNSLLLEKKFNNDYYELYKLKIIDRILQKYISLRISTNDNRYIEKIIDYVERNNLVSHLMSMYSKIYLSLALYFSYEKSEKSQEKSKQYYFIYQGCDDKKLLLHEFSNISKQIIKNYAINYFKQMNMSPKNKFNEEELILIGEKLISEYINNKELSLKNETFMYIEALTKEVHLKNELDNNYIFEKIEKIIEEKILMGLSKVKLSNIKESKLFNDIGFEHYSLEIEKEYTLYLYFSSFYKSVFEKVLNKNKELIELLVKNSFKSYMNTIPSYTDLITGLPNINKLKSELNKYNNKKITFFEVYLNSVVIFSESNNVKKSDEFFNKLAQKIGEETNSFRLFGPKIGIILEENEDYREVIEYLLNLNFEFENKNYTLDSVIAISKGPAINILDKSFYTLSSAKRSSDKLFIYE